MYLFIILELTWPCFPEYDTQAWKRLLVVYLNFYELVCYFLFKHKHTIMVPPFWEDMTTALLPSIKQGNLPHGHKQKIALKIKAYTEA